MNDPKKLLKDVSRSFYLSLAALPADIGDTMSVGYLFCRAADTVADTPTATNDEKWKLLTEFKNLFAQFPLPKENLQGFLRDLAQANLAATPAEKRLLNGLQSCADWFNRLPRTDQSLIASVVGAVIIGMQMDISKFQSAEVASPVALSTEKELEEYIRWIGGEPGRFWTDVCLAHWPNLRVQNQAQFRQDGVIFGTGLQMVNILRDLQADLKIGRCYIPEELLSKNGLSVADLQAKTNEDAFFTLYNDLIEQTLFRLTRGLAYIDQLPKTEWRLRMAVALPLLIGARTLRKLRGKPSVFRSSEAVKIKRSEVYGLILRALPMTWSSAWLKREFEREP